MTPEAIISHCRRMSDDLMKSMADIGKYSQASEFLRTYAGPKSSFYEQAHRMAGQPSNTRGHSTAQILQSYADYVERGLHGDMTPERKAQLDVVSDLLDQANTLLQDTALHPASAAVLVGATLEEFLRTWVEKEGMAVGTRKPCLDTYMKMLYEAELITKQDLKDITSWGGIRNDAAHGNWDAVASREKVAIMLEGVNLFLRQNQTK